MAEKSKILIIGGTGYIGKFIVKASVKEGHPTFLLVRESTVNDPVKEKIAEHFKSLGVNQLIVWVLNHLLHFSFLDTVIECCYVGDVCVYIYIYIG